MAHKRLNRQEKAWYVLRARQSRPHQCHWPGCTEQVPPARWGCRAHWCMLPWHLRQAIWDAYRPGQEEDGRPSEAYLAAARAIQEWIRRAYPAACEGRSDGLA